ncbi:hypothetical protein RF55_9017 [Lasius niger]|uniref:Uncharacterized protein n=1 Tax=Lasius niger TaxID=67767 RepID=A0A0J7KL80_LASNI|nr:hypothetical protein RF55_9017 [Lasius niger]
MLGLAMKSLTSSRKVLTILNKYGHSVGYTVAEELETEMTYTAYENNKLIPPGIRPIKELSTHVAFDNYDRFDETFSGKDTLHDTVGIIYQFYPENYAEEDSKTLNLNIRGSNDSDTYISVISPNIATSFMNPSNPSNDTVAECTPRKRRRFEEIPREIQPYYRKPSAKTTLIPIDVINNINENCKISKKNATIKDLLWVFSLSLIKSTPMWTGFNSTITSDNSERQIVDYLPQINLSPTSYSVVHETLVCAQKIAKECNQPQIIVSYDLAIAKMAMQMKMTETPKFDNIFINLGAFHIQMAFFKAIGKYIDACGITDILVQAKVLAEGSPNYARWILQYLYLAQILGDDLCRSLPAFHAFTGSDYTASFYRKDIEQCGWICNDEMIKLRWFEGDPTPLTVDDILVDDNDDDDDDDDDENLETVDINSDDDE